MRLPAPLEPALQNRTVLLKAIGVVLGLLSLAPALLAQGGAETAAYRKVQEAREAARRFGTPSALKTFERTAERFLEDHPESERTAIVNLWTGDLLKEADPRQAHAAYLRCGTAEARERAFDIAFRFEAPPELRIDRWIGEPMDPRKASGKVTVLAFFSPTHPHTKRLLPRLTLLHRAFENRDVRIAGIAAVVDDHNNQRPARIEEHLCKRTIPFPVGIDRQRPGGASETLRAYRGRLLPWAVLLDRYGRVAWVGPIHAQGNSFAMTEKRIEELLAAPTLAALGAGVRRGDAEALRRLASIRTKATVPALLEAVPASPLEREGIEALRRLCPESFPLDDLAEARERWHEAEAGLRYDFAKDRLVASR